jgi:hypothetical protein
MAEAWITLLRFATVHEGEMARGLLEAAGIEAMVLDSGMMSMAWHLAPALGGVRLQVRPEDRAAALEVLSEDEPEIGALWEDADARKAHLMVIEGGRAHEPDDVDPPRALPGSGLPAAFPFDEEADEAAEILAKRALTAAMLGVLIPFALHLYSATLLLRLSQSPGNLSRRGRAWAGMALALDALVLIPTLLFIGTRLL